MSVILNEKKIRTFIAENLLTIDEFAKECGLSQGTLTRVLRGENASGSTAKKIADRMQCGPCELVIGSGVKKTTVSGDGGSV